MERTLCPLYNSPSSLQYLTIALLLAPRITLTLKPIFIFESYWTEIPGFHDCVKEAWNKSVPPQQNPLSIFHIKLCRVAKSLKSWSKNLVSQTKIAMATCMEVIAQMDLAQENRVMSLEEI
jgi:hypothetical protein